MGHGEQGYFLLEGLLAAVLLGVGLLGLMGLELAALRSQGAARARQEALALALGTLEAEGLKPEGEPGAGPRSQGTASMAVSVLRDPADPARVFVRVAWGAGTGRQTLSLSRRLGN